MIHLYFILQRVTHHLCWEGQASQAVPSADTHCKHQGKKCLVWCAMPPVLSVVPHGHAPHLPTQQQTLTHLWRKNGNKIIFLKVVNPERYPSQICTCNSAYILKTTIHSFTGITESSWENHSLEPL